MAPSPKKHLAGCSWMTIAGISFAVVGSAYFIGKYLRNSSVKVTSPVVENQALIFVKPHGHTNQVRSFVEAELVAAGFKIVKSGKLNGTTIGEKGSIDAHYSAIGTYAMKMHPKDLPLAAEKKAEFKAKFGLDFDTGALNGSILNIAQTLEKFNWTSEKLGEAFEKAKAKNGSFKLAPGCYTAYVDEIKTHVVNGFYASMRAEYVKADAQLSWFVVSWPEASLAWSDFRAKVLGATDPTVADKSSIRAKILNNSAAMDLPFVPNTGKNCVHGSASPLEAFNERRIWIGVSIAGDLFGAQLLTRGVSAQQIEWMCSNPTVDGKPLFDIVEDTNTTECLQKLTEIAKNAQ